ncbi:hypothetical protein NPIL_4611 [Nephila pilipes]|uniref:Uncharacterized protein n=1 Tax=Nephila pilipes TaxID=299642 RepID=A0A8X6NE93_NEPPI|nr:hypothetical protein NPIL_4611 [Nephila pilipes]
MFNPVLSLELLSLKKVAVLMHSDPDIRDLEKGFVIEEKWAAVVKKKVSTLDLPPIIKKRIPPLLKDIRNVVDRWEMDHITILGRCSWENDIECVWNDDLTINGLKTAKIFIQNENHSLVKRFLMACVYWLEEETKDLWKKLPENVKANCSSIHVSYPKYRWEIAVKDWVELSECGVADWRQHSFSHPLTWYCHDSIIIQGNLLRQLSPQDQLSVFKGMMKGSIEMHTKIFCLSIMNAEQLKEVMKNEPLPKSYIISRHDKTHFLASFRKRISSYFA